MVLPSLLSLHNHIFFTNLNLFFIFLHWLFFVFPIYFSFLASTMSTESPLSNHSGHTPTSNINKGYQNDTLNSYLMHPNENPALVLVIPLLNVGNYHSWSRSMTMTMTMTMTLRSNKKLHFTKTAEWRSWFYCMGSMQHNDHVMVKQFCWFLNLSKHLVDEKRIKHTKELKDRFYHGDVFRITDTQEEICTRQQGDSYISSYYTKLKMLWKELDNFHPVPACECAKSCIRINKIWSYKDCDQVLRSLQGLNNKYSTVRSHIMLMGHLPNIFNVYSLLIHQERKIILPIDESKLLAFPTCQYQGRGTTPFRGKNTRWGRSFNCQGRGTKLFTHCGMTNHSIDACYKKHGYPPHWQQQQSHINNVSSDHAHDNEFQYEPSKDQT